MTSIKKIKAPISIFPSEELYALLLDIESKDEEDINNVMNDSDAEFVNREGIENLESDISEKSNG